MKTNSTKKIKKLPAFLDKDNPLEKVIEKRVCDYGETLGIKNRKYANPNRRAAPDRIFFTPGRAPVGFNVTRTGTLVRAQPLTWFCEFKRRGKKPTPAQLEEHEFYRALGFYVFVVDNIQEGKQLMDLMC